MKTALYMRRARVQVGTVVINYENDDSLRIKFRVTKNPWATEANRAHVDIYNLADVRREMLSTLISKRIPTQVSIEAGYANATVGTIFRGPLLSVAHSREGGDWITKIIAASMMSRDIPVAGTYSGPNTNVGTVAADLLAKIGRAAVGLDVSAAITRALSGDLAGLGQTLNKAFSINGMGMDVLERLVKPAGFLISEQDGKIVLVKTGEKVGRSIVLSSDSGLVGAIDPITDVRRPGVFLIRARSLLRHEIQIHSAVQLDSIAQKGLFVVEQLDHNGDTHGGSSSFITEFHGRGFQGTPL